jgi:hypothetical protein
MYCNRQQKRFNPVDPCYSLQYLKFGKFELVWCEKSMSHHLFILSASDAPLYSLVHASSKPTTSTLSPLSSNLPTWSSSAFAGTLTALSGATSATQSHHVQGGGRMGGGQDRHVIQMIANASLDVVEDVMRKDPGMWVVCCVFAGDQGPSLIPVLLTTGT